MSGFGTARLVAAPLSPSDTAVFERLWGDPRVGATLGGTRSAAQVQDEVAAGLEHWRQYGFGRWVLRAGTTPVGTVKLAVWHGRGRPEVELGYALFPEFWGLGYATEAGSGALEHARATLRLGEVVAFTLPGNRSSSAVMERLGFVDDQHVVIGGRSHVLRRRRLSPDSA